MLKSEKIAIIKSILLIIVSFWFINVQSQEIRIDVTTSTTTLKSLIEKIEKETDYTFIFNSSVDLNKKISLNLKQQTIERVLNHALANTNISYEIKLKQILLIVKENKTTVSQQKNETRIISGHVLDLKEEPIIGASVFIKEGAVGTITDIAGKFTLEVTPNTTIIISYIGYKAQEIKIDGKTTFRIILLEDEKVLDEVIVIGYGTVKKSDLTGSVATIKTAEISTIPANSIEGLLQGRSAGLQVINASEDPGAGSTVRIRGGSSLRGSNAPLLVVDGFPMGDAGNLKQINPDDIASIEVLKDASASAIYGSRGANGVILVTTKKAKKGSTIVTIKNQLTTSQFSSTLIQHQDPILMMQLNNEGRINSGYDPLYVGEYSASGVYYPSQQEVESGAWPHFTNWSDLVLRSTPLLNNTTVSVSSANEKTRFNLSGNYFTQEGAYIKDMYNKGIVNLSLSHNLSDKIFISSMTNFSKDFRNNNTGLAYYRNPLWPVYDGDGDYFLVGNQDFSHPIAISDTRKNQTKGVDIMSSLMADWKILESLVLRSQLNYRYRGSVSDRYNPKKYTQSGFLNNGAAEMENNFGEEISSETYLTYKSLFAEHHEITLMGGFSYEESLSRSFSMKSYGFINESLQNENMASGDPTLNTHSNGYSQTKLASYMFRANYSSYDKYLFTFTARRDGSSKFGTNNKWALFPSGAFGWKLHNESFIKELNTFDEFKLRLSYGISGNQGISAYQTLSRYGQDFYYVGDKWITVIGPGYVVARTGADYRYTEWGGIPNKGLKWESTKQANVGVDMAFFRRRLRVTADYYNKHTYDLLRQSYLPPTSGYDKMWVNDGDISNQGVELTIDGDIISTKDWSFSGMFIFSKNKNKVLSLGKSESSGLQTDTRTGMQYEYFGTTMDLFKQTSPNILAVGYPVNVFFGYKTDGIIQTLQEGLDAGLLSYEAEPGEFKYVNLDEYPTINEGDRTVIGDPNPDFTTSLNLSLSYKNVDIGLFLNGVFGNDVLYTSPASSAKYTPKRWTPDNPTNDYPRLRDSRQFLVSDWFIRDGSFVRIQNLNLGYTFKKPGLIQNSRIYLNVDNLYTFTKFDGYDPEVGVNGRYGASFPRYRKFTVGIELSLNN